MSTSNPVSLLALTRFQKELWLANSALPEGHPGLYAAGRFILEGCPDPKIIERALSLLVAHFPILSATFRQTEEALALIMSKIAGKVVKG